MAEIAKGLPGALVVTKILPLVGAFPPIRTSVVGAKETLIVQLAPAARLPEQLLVSEKFSEARIPAIVNAVSPALLNVTTWGALVELMG